MGKAVLTPRIFQIPVAGMEVGDEKKIDRKVVHQIAVIHRSHNVRDPTIARRDLKHGEERRGKSVKQAILAGQALPHLSEKHDGHHLHHIGRRLP